MRYMKVNGVKYLSFCLGDAPFQIEMKTYCFCKNIFLSVLSNKVVHGRSSYLKSVSTLTPYFGTVILKRQL